MVEKISNLQARERKSQELFAFTDPFPLVGTVEGSEDQELALLGV